MFTNLPQAAKYNNPWDISLDARRSSLVRRSVRVAYYYDTPDNSTFRYRVYNMVYVLNSLDSRISASWFHSGDGDFLDTLPDIADVIVICRARYDHRLSRLITRARQLGRRVLFDCDDLVFDPSYVHLVLQSLDQDFSNPAIWDFWFAYVGRMNAAMQLCDDLIVTNQFLADQAKRVFSGNIHIVPNFLNDEQMSYSETILEGKRAAAYSSADERIHLGYFSGSPSHNRDFEIAASALAELMDKDPRLHVRIVGFLDVKGPVQRHMDRIERHSLQDFVNLQRLIGETEINIAPLQDNIFTNCKSELKYFEAAIVGTATLATPTYTFRSGIQHGKNGLLVNAQDWQDSILEMVSKLDGNREAYRDLVETAREDAITRFGWSEQLRTIKQALGCSND